MGIWVEVIVMRAAEDVTLKLSCGFAVMGIKGRRVHMIEELSDTIISFQRGMNCRWTELGHGVEAWS